MSLNWFNRDLKRNQHTKSCYPVNNSVFSPKWESDDHYTDSFYYPYIALQLVKSAEKCINYCFIYILKNKHLQDNKICLLLS